VLLHLEGGALTDGQGSGSSGVKQSIAAGGSGDAAAASGDGDGASASSSGSGWTAWRGDDEWGWGPGGSRLLQPCLTTVVQPASYEVLYNIDGGVAKKATMPKQGAPFIELENLDSLAPVSA
jgi:hypothetical protein